MRKIEFKNASFVKTACLPEDYPKVHVPEIAFVGRSNVGKSSLLNHLLQSKGLAKTSSTPGKTQGLQFFSVNNHLSFADLPGYGFAKVAKSVKEQWQEMIETYLKERKELKLLLFLLDIRRAPSQEDLQMHAWLQMHHLPFILIFTKVDKVSVNEKNRQTQEIVALLQPEDYVHYSTVKNMGRNQLIAQIHQHIFSKDYE